MVLEREAEHAGAWELACLAPYSRDRFVRSAVLVPIAKRHMCSEKVALEVKIAKQAEPKVCWPILDILFGFYRC